MMDQLECNRSLNTVYKFDCFKSWTITQKSEEYKNQGSEGVYFWKIEFAKGI